MAIARAFSRAVWRNGDVFHATIGIRRFSSKALMYDSFGQPEKVVRLSDHPVSSELGAEDVSVEMLMCPVNPADINQIQGVYAIKPPLPAVGGGEGVGVVRGRGQAVTSLEEGDWVVPAVMSLGTWRTKMVANQGSFTRISSAMPLELAATLSVNPTTAYRMLKDFVTLKPGDCVIQNGSNSGVGQSVIQLAAAWGLKSINIIRDRPNFEEMKSFLLSLGATEVVTEKVAQSHQMKAIVENHGGPPRLGFNCVGGKSATNLMKHLTASGVLVTYGGMSREPVTVGTGSLIFKNLRLVGHWNSKWLERNLHSEQHLEMMSEVCRLAEQGRLKPPLCQVHPLMDYRAALARAMEPFVGTKQLLDMQK